jgi:hypothetical protein
MSQRNNAMEILKQLNLALRFGLELSLLAAVGYWGFRLQASWPMKILLGIGLPVLVAIAWGLFVAPKATYALSGPLHLGVELGLLALGAGALFASGKPTLSWVYTIAVIANKTLLALWKQ